MGEELVPQMRTRPNDRPVLIWVERSLLTLGIVLLGVYGGVSAHSQFYQAYDTWRFDRAIEGRHGSMGAFVTEALHVPGAPLLLADGADGPDQQDWSPERIRAYEGLRADGDRLPIGRLEIPSIDLRVMVLEGTDDWTLNRGVGRIEGTAKPGDIGNLGIAGHRDGFFRSLRKLSTGERILLRTLDGSYEYEVDDIEIVSPEEVRVLETSAKPSLTLVTCYPFYYVGNAPHRYIVKANLVQAVE